jgi:hypothetical protein
MDSTPIVESILLKQTVAKYYDIQGKELKCLLELWVCGS